MCIKHQGHGWGDWRSTVLRVTVRHDLVEAKQQQLAYSKHAINASYYYYYYSVNAQSTTFQTGTLAQTSRSFWTFLSLDPLFIFCGCLAPCLPLPLTNFSNSNTPCFSLSPDIQSRRNWRPSRASDLWYKQVPIPAQVCQFQKRPKRPLTQRLQATKSHSSDLTSL